MRYLVYYSAYKSTWIGKFDDKQEAIAAAKVMGSEYGNAFVSDEAENTTIWEYT